jgi:hypothetical protein
MAQPWIGVQKLAVVPTFNKQFDTTPPNDWDNQIMRRMLYDPDPDTGADRSLRSYISAISYGQAILEAKLFPHAFSDGPSVVEAAYQSLPSGHGYPYVLCIIPWFDGDANRKGWFRTVGENGVIAVSRVAMFDGPPVIKHRQIMGVWAMEILHAIPGLPDLYAKEGNPHPNPPIGDFDNMCYNAGTHSCAYLKQAVGWLPANAIMKNIGKKKEYKLHAVAISSPPPGRAAAVSIASRVGAGTFMVEARWRCDVYERGFAPRVNGKPEFRGLPSEGVIVYQVTSPNHLEQVKFVSGALALNQSYSDPTEGFTVKPIAALEGGITVQITRTPDPQCAGLLQEIAELQQDIEQTKDINEKKKLISAKGQLVDKAKKLGCY